ncbi:MAG: ParA family protein [Pseudomonadota bacterium]
MQIVFASSKGGVGKSTSCAAIAALLAGRGEGVAVLDLDQNRTLDAWGQASGVARLAPDASLVDAGIGTAMETGMGPGTGAGDGAPTLPGLAIGAVAADDFADAFRAARAAGWPHVFVDLPGIREVTLMKAVAKADLVVIPAQHSEPDIRQAMTIARDIRDIEETLGRAIPHAVLFTKVRPLRTRLDRFVEAELDRSGLPRFATPLVDRIAYKEMFLDAVAPHAKEPDRGAGPELAALVAEMEAMIAGAAAGSAEALPQAAGQGA